MQATLLYIDRLLVETVDWMSSVRASNGVAIKLLDKLRV